MVFSGCVSREDVSNCIIISGKEKSSQVIVVAIWAVELFEVSRPFIGGADRLCKRGITGCAFDEERETI